MTPKERVNPKRCRNETQREELAGIVKDGCTVVKVMQGSDPPTPEWAYTMVLLHSYGHPEVLVIGLGHDLTQTLLHNVNYRIRHQELSFRAGSSCNDLIVGYECFFEAINPSLYEDWFAANRWFYDREPFPAVQMLCPNVHGVYPWQNAADAYLRWDQPLLADPPKRFRH